MRPCIERERHDVGIGPRCEDNDDVEIFGSHGLSPRDARNDVEHVRAGNRRVAWFEMRHSDSRRIFDRDVTEQSFGCDAIERVSKRTWSTVESNVFNNIGESLFRGLVAVEQRERLAIVCTHPYFKAGRTGDGIVHRATDFKTKNFARDDAVLDDGYRPTRANEIDESKMGHVGNFGFAERFGNRRDQRSIGDVPHGDGKREVTGLTRDDSGRRLGENVELSTVLFQRPQQSGAESAGLLFFDEDPRSRTANRISVDERCAASEDRGPQRFVANVARRVLANEMFADERAQLQREELTLARVVGRHGGTEGSDYFLDLRSP